MFGEGEEHVAGRDRERRMVHILLPGYSRIPSGGYKILYEYASHLSLDRTTVVHVHHSSRLLPGERLSPARALGRDIWHHVIGHLRHLRGQPIEWMAIGPDVRVLNWVRLPRIKPGRGVIMVASSVHTASFVKKAVDGSRGLMRGVYFVQSFESWDAPAETVAQTWRLGLDLLVVAPWLADVAQDLGVPARLIPNAVDAQQYPLGPPLVERPRRVVAQISKASVKRPDVLVDVYRLLQEADPGIELFTFGTCETPSSMPRGVVHVRSPSADDLRSLYRSARVYVCTSDTEGWHLPPAEALLSGASVASTDIGGVRAYAEGVAAFSPPGDAEGLARNVVRLVNNPVSAQELVDCARMKLMTHTPSDAARMFDAALWG